MSEEKANQRVEEFKREMKTLTVRLKEAENRAEQAEKSVKRLQKEVDRLEGNAIRFTVRSIDFRIDMEINGKRNMFTYMAVCVHT